MNAFHPTKVEVLVGKEATTARLSSDFVGELIRHDKIRSVAAALTVLLLGLAFPCSAQSQTIHETPLAVAADQASRWTVDNADVTWLRGNCRVLHGDNSIHCSEALIVVDGPAGRLRCRIVMDGVHGPEGVLAKPMPATIYTTIEPEVQAPGFPDPPARLPAIWQHLPGKGGAAEQHGAASSTSTTGNVQQVQFQLNAPLSAGPTLVPPPSTEFPSQVFPGDPVVDPVPNGVATGGLTELPRVISGDNELQFFVGDGTQSVTIRSRNPATAIPNETLDRQALGESVVVARGGVTIEIRDVSAQLPDGQFLEFGTVSLSADRIVAWLPLISDMLLGRANVGDAQGELYLEGDIVFRQGDRVIYADSMYYNVAQQTGMVLDAEAITTVPNYDGIVRLKSDVLQQVAEGNFRAFNAAVTTSRLGVPHYWMQSEQLTLQDRPLVEVDRRTGIATQGTEPYVGSRNNFVYLGGVPVFYWPRFSAPLRKPPLFLTGANVRNDDIFGTQVLLEWDLFQLLGYDRAPEGVETRITTDYLSERGPAFGTKTTYEFPGLFGVPGEVRGAYDSYLIYDTGLDTLGRDRRNLPPAETWRGRSFWQHRGRTAGGWEFIGQLGYLSDRNFLEQYFEEEWDQNADHVTGLRVQRYAGSSLLDLSVQAQLNDFYKETERLPVLEHYVLGLSPLGNALTWSMKNKVGYEKLNVADTPTNAIEIANFNVLPGEVDAEGLNASTKHELTVPLDLGPLNVNPFLGGEASYFGEAADGDSLTRLIGQVGIRASLPMYRIDPTIQSSLLNIRGLAHKVEWVGEYFYADSDANLDDLPYYDSLDDNAQEQFRRRLITDKFGGVLPAKFDPRTFGLRQGLQRYVTNPSDVIAADLSQIRLGVHQRFQTHRGLQGRDRIVDVFSLDVDTILFPDADRDNFGESLGPTTYDARYHLGDRVSLLSDGYIDFFDDGLRSISAGVRTSRPGLGDVYVGLLSLEGPISSTVLRTTLDYRLNEKWIVSAASTYDLGDAGNVGQSFGLKKIGESFLAGVELNVDPGRDNVGIGFYLVPRFFPTSRGRIGGQAIPSAGAMGLE